jgi:hypothetical protein
MGFLFVARRDDECCLCGNRGELTREHKIKASAIRQEFGAENMAIGKWGDEDLRFRYAQGPKSANLQFSASVCGECNNKTTQAPDREFDRTHTELRRRLESGCDPYLLFNEPRYRVGSEPYLNFFRYFAKYLCCQIANSGGPRWRRVARFALRHSSANCVWLKIEKDKVFPVLSAGTGMQSYAAHGGLALRASKSTGNPKSFQTSISLGAIQYVFGVNLNAIETAELTFTQRAFIEKCRKAVLDQREHGVSGK